MSLPRILILGAGGQLGRHVQDALADRPVAALDRQACDVGDERQLAHGLATAAPDIVINCAAYTRVDDAETDRAAAERINARGPGLLAALCADRELPLIHISTDYVFGGVPPRDEHLGYAATDDPHPLNYYGATKLAGEIAIRAALDRHWIIRTSWLFSGLGSNFARTILRLAGERPELRIVHDQLGTPTWAGDLATACAALADAIGCGAPPAPGTYHFAGVPAVSWYAFAGAIVDAALAAGRLQRRPAIVPITSVELARPAPRPADSRLDAGEFPAALGLTAASWRNGLAAMLALPVAA